MCGRFTYYLTWREIHDLYRLTAPAAPPSNMRERYNICPTTRIDAVIERDGQRQLERMRWGLIPSWWSKKRSEMRLATFNARAETITEKQFFRNAFKHRRCIIPVSGYYEWETGPDGKQPHYFTAADGSPALSIAGLWEEWQDKEADEKVLSCTMIITSSNDWVGEVHDRMPVLLTADQYEPWLVGKAGVEILKPAPNDMLRRWPVSKRVNKSTADDGDATLIERLAA